MRIFQKSRHAVLHPMQNVDLIPKLPGRQRTHRIDDTQQYPSRPNTGPQDIRPSCTNQVNIYIFYLDMFTVGDLLS